MSAIDNVIGKTIGDLAAVRPDAPGSLGGAVGETPFRRLLERLEALAQAPAAPVADAEGLQQALRRADDDYVVAMDLRRRIEAAVRGE